MLSHSRQLSYIVWFELRVVGLSEVTFVKDSTLSMQKRFIFFFPKGYSSPWVGRFSGEQQRLHPCYRALLSTA